MRFFTYTLVSDGPTDVNLIPIINWTLKELGGIQAAQGKPAELWRLPERPTCLAERIQKAVELVPCEALFIHRDAENKPRAERDHEIQEAVGEATAIGYKIPMVALVPVRMLEAWLLFNEEAIRRAAGNPHGKVRLNLPALKTLEDRCDPKEDLLQALKSASELRGRRLKKFNATQAFYRIMDFLDDFEPLRQLSAFIAFEWAIKRAKEMNWAPGFYGVSK